ncbi:MAG TPA: response regulator [Pyrinomonadaceae bacterium]|nr:response regulator [Pyrinomonadaceae bacterium]
MLTGRKLLLADDSLTIQKVVSLTFGDEAMEVTSTGGGAEALEKLNESLPDIVLADVFMPEPNGYALCERIKGDERTRHIPVVLLVGTFEPFNEAEARRVGADDVLTKPFQSIRDLVNKVGGLLGGQPEEKGADAERARDQYHDAGETTRDLSPFAAEARAADPAAATAATSTPADAFADFDMDDATIQTTPAAAFDALHAAPAPSFSRINEEEQFSDRAETDEALFFGEDDAPALEIDAPAPEMHAAADLSPAASLSSGSPVASPVAESAFDARASRNAEADDALLELGDAAPASTANAEADDFILDIGGDDDSFDPPAFAPAHDATAEADMLFAEEAQTTEVPEAFAMQGAFTEAEASTESPLSVEPGMWEANAGGAPVEAEAPSASVEAANALADEDPMELEAPEMLESPALLFANEPLADAHDSEISLAGDEFAHAPHAPVWDKDPVAASIVAHAGGVALAGTTGASQSSEPVAADAGATAAAATESSAPATSSAPSQAASTSGQAASASSHASASAASLSPEVLDELVRRVVAQMSEQVVREIAWEVVPDLAERLIRQRLEEERARAQ